MTDIPQTCIHEKEMRYHCEDCEQLLRERAESAEKALTEQLTVNQNLGFELFAATEEIKVLKRPWWQKLRRKYA